MLPKVMTSTAPADAIGAARAAAMPSESKRVRPGLPSMTRIILCLPVTSVLVCRLRRIVRAVAFDADEMAEPPAGLLERGRTQIARALGRDLDHREQRCRLRGEDEDAVGKLDRLFDLMGDEDDGLAGLAPDIDDLRAHPPPG